MSAWGKGDRFYLHYLHSVLFISKFASGRENSGETSTA
jgi:hypothetical protein